MLPATVRFAGLAEAQLFFLLKFRVETRELRRPAAAPRHWCGLAVRAVLSLLHPPSAVLLHAHWLQAQRQRTGDAAGARARAPWARGCPLRATAQGFSFLTVCILEYDSRNLSQRLSGEGFFGTIAKFLKIVLLRL